MFREKERGMHRRKLGFKEQKLKIHADSPILNSIENEILNRAIVQKNIGDCCPKTFKNTIVYCNSTSNDL